MYTVARADGSPQLVPVDAMRDQDDGRSKMAVNEPPVYEDLFAIGTVPPDLCPIHNTTTSPTIASSSVSGTTQIANSVMPTSSQFAASPPSLAPRPSDIVLERVLGSDGLMHVVMRQRR